MDLDKQPSMRTLNAPVPLRLFVVPKTGAARLWDNTQIDPKIIMHSSQSKLGVQPQGTAIAQNEFPNLELLPIGSPKPALKPIPTQWPDLKFEAIPTTWPNLALLHATSVQVVTPKPAAQ
jgi:hypothetical protein